MNISRSIKIAQAKTDLNNGDIASACEFSDAFFSNIKSGKCYPSVKRLDQIAKAFKMKVSEFVALGEEK